MYGTCPSRVVLMYQPSLKLVQSVTDFQGGRDDRLAAQPRVHALGFGRRRRHFRHLSSAFAGEGH